MSGSQAIGVVVFFVLAAVPAPLLAQGSGAVAPCNAVAVGPDDTGTDGAGSGSGPGGADTETGRLPDVIAYPDRETGGAAAADDDAPDWGGPPLVIVNPGGDGDDSGDTTTTIVTRPEPRVVGIEDHFFVRDDGYFGFDIINDAEPAANPCLDEMMPVRITVIGNQAFMDLPPVQTFALRPKEVRRVAVELENFLRRATAGNETRWRSPDFEDDRLIGAEIEVIAGTFKKSFYVYRLIDAADWDPHDEILEFSDTAEPVEAADIERVRTLHFLTGNSDMRQRTTFRLGDTTHFRIEPESGGLVQRLIFDPETVANDLTTVFEIESPTGTIWQLDLKGDGVLQKVYIDAALMKTVFGQFYALNRTELVPPERLDEAGLTGPLLWNDAIQPDKVDATVLEILEKTVDRLIPVAAGLAIQTTEPAGVQIDVFRKGDNRQVHNDPPKGLGVTFAYGNGAISETGVVDDIDFGADGRPGTSDDVENLVADLLAWRPHVSEAEAIFRLTEILNEHETAFIDVYLAKLINKGGFTRERLVNIVAKIFSHEIGHAVGVHHTGVDLSVPNLPRVPCSERIRNRPDFRQTRLYCGGGLLETSDDFYTGFYLTSGGVAYLILDYEFVDGQGVFTTDRNVLTTDAQDQTDAHYQLDGMVAVAGGNIGGSPERSDLMNQGIDPTGTKTMSPVSEPLYRLALGTDWTREQAVQALELEANYASRPLTGGPWADTNEPDYGDERDPWELTGPLLWIADARRSLLRTVDVEAVVGSGPERRSVIFSNSGDAVLTIASLQIVGGAGWKVSGIQAPLELAPRSSRSLEVVFDPAAAGPDQAELVVTGNSDGGDARVRLRGYGRSPSGDLALTIDNNNLGGVGLSRPGRRVDKLGRIENTGAAALTVKRVILNGAAKAQWQLTGFPPGFSPRQPLVLAPGESQTFGVVFDPRHTGLQTIQIRAESDDPDSRTTTASLVGTGLADSGSALDYGGDFLLLETAAGEPRRLVSDARGDFELELPAAEPYRLSFYDPVSGLIAENRGVSAAAGRQTILTSPVFDFSRAPDGDGDGLPDDIERIVGTSPQSADSDGDGINDFDAISVRRQ